MVNASWRGISYARRYVVPANPDTAAQQETRSVFAWLAGVWKQLAADAQAPWTAASTGQKYYNRNLYMGLNTKALRPGDDLSAYIGSPGANGGLPPESVAATGSSGTASVIVTPPDLPTGWTVSKVVATILKNDDPHSSTTYTSQTGSATASPWTISFSDLDAGDYTVVGWVVYSVTGSSLKYGASINKSVTVS